jgi:multidrug efflux pump subunit AcrB
MGGVAEVLVLPDNPFDLWGHGRCLLLRLAAPDEGPVNRARVAAAVQRALQQEITTARLRVRDPAGQGPFPQCAYPIDLALYGQDGAKVRQWAEKLVARLNTSPELTDAGMSSDATLQPHLYLDLDREAIAKKGLKMTDVLTTLQIYFGSAFLQQFDSGKQLWRIQMSASAPMKNQVKDLQNLKVRADDGTMVPLSAVMKVHEGQAPQVIYRFNGRPMLAVTANPAAGQTVASSRAGCVKLAEEVRSELHLPKTYRWKWLPAAAAAP